MQEPFPHALDNLTGEQIAPLAATIPPGFPEVWRDLAGSFYASLLGDAGLSLPEPECARLAVALAQGVGRDLGGDQVYIPRNARHRTQNTRQAIAREFNGKNLHTLARKYRVSVRHVRRIVAAKSAP